MVDESLASVLQRDRMGALLQLRVTKPAGQSSFRFNSLVFRFYGQINWKPKLENSEIGLELVDGDFAVVLAKDIYDDDAKLLVAARLYGTFVIGKARIGATVGFSRDTLGENRIQFALQVQPHTLSAEDFLDKLPVSKNGKTEPMNKGSTVKSLELPDGLQALARDLAQPNLKLSLAGSYSLTRSKLETLQFTVFAKESSVLCLGFFDNARLRDMVLYMEINTWTIMLNGKLDLGKFTATVEIVFIKGRGLRVRGRLAPNSGCTLATLARMDIFNDKEKPQAMNIAKEAHGTKTGGEPPLDLSTGVRTRGTLLSFDLLVLKTKSQKQEPEPNKPAGNDTQPVKQDGDKPVAAKKGEVDSSYQVKHIKFLSHSDLDWQIIQDKVKFENLGICFDVRNPRQESKRKMAGLLYATWKLSSVELFVYVLGKKDAQDTDFWAGLSIKKSPKGSSKKALDIINDPKFASGESGSDSKLTLPVKLPTDIKANPEDQQVAAGLKFDGRLMAHFFKNKKADKSFVLKDVSIYIDLESPFTISDYEMVGSFFMDLRIKYAMIKEKRDFSCHMKGGLVFENGLYLSVEAEIPMNNKKPPAEDQKPDAEKDKKIESTAKKLTMDVSTRKTKVEKYLGKVRVKDDDIVGLVKVGKSKPTASTTGDKNYESRLSMIGDNTKTKHEASFKSLLTSSYGNSTDDAINGMAPKDSPLLKDTYHSGMEFAAVMVVRREVTGDKSERKVKAVAATFTAAEPWQLIGKLAIKDVGLSVIVEWDEKRQRSISGVIQGTITLGDVASLAAQVVYLQQILTVSGVLEMDLKNLFEGMETGAGEKPDLALTVEEKIPSLMVGMEAKFLDMKLQGYRVEVLATPDFEFFSGLTLQALWFTISHNRVVTPRTTEMTMGGRMLLGNSVSLDVSGESKKDGITLRWEAHKISPAKIAKGLVEGGLEGADGDKTKPELPTNTGFGDWDKEEKSDASTSGKVVFVNDGSGRRFDSAELEVSLTKATAEDAWMLIDDYIKLKKFALVIKIKAEKSNKKTLGVGLKADFYLKDRVTKDWPAGFDSIEMVATRSDLKMTLTPKAGRTIGDIIWCVTSGFLDVPSDFDLPAFPIFEMSLNWKTKDATVRGFFTSEKKPWTIPYIEYVAKINEPHIRGTIKRQGKRSTRVSIAGKLSFLSDLVELDAEYVLLKGPLLIEGHDIKSYYDMIKKIWKRIKDALDLLRKAGRVVGTAAQAVVTGVVGAVGTVVAVGSAVIGTAIGSFIGALSLGGPFLLGVGAFIIGGLLGGGAWLAAKINIIQLLRELCIGTDHNVEDMIGGFLDGVSPRENEDAKGNRGDQSQGGPLRGGDNKAVSVLPGGDENLLKRMYIDADSYIELSGSGTSAGPGGELTEFILEYKYRRGALARVTRIVDADSRFWLAGIVRFTVQYQPSDPTVPVLPTAKSAPISRVLEAPETTMMVGRRYRIPWQRPVKTSGDSYTVRLVVSKMSQIWEPDLKQEWKIQLKPKVEDCFAPEKTILDVPPTLGIGADLMGYVFFKDADGNIRQGIDDRSRVKIQVEPPVKTKLSLLQNGCAIWAVTPLQEGSYKMTATVLEKQFVKEFKVAPITTFGDLVVGGPGLSNGKAGQANVSIVVVDRYSVLSEVDQLVALVSCPRGAENMQVLTRLQVIKDGTREQVELIAGSTPETSAMHTGSYTRPSAGPYEVHVKVNDSHVGASPYKLTSSETEITINWTKWSITAPRRRVAVQETQNVTIDVYDQSGSSRRLEEDPLRGWQLQAIPVDDDDNELTSPAKQTLGKLELLQGSELARYRVQKIAISQVGRYKLSLLAGTSGGSLTAASLGSDASEYVTVVAQRSITSFFVAGDGLQTGWEKSEANVTFKCFDQYGSEMRLTDATAEWSLVAADGKTVLKQDKVNYEQGYFTYTRPVVQGEGTSEACFLHVVLHKQGVTIEASGSPFTIRTESYFNELDFAEKSFWYKDRFMPNRLSWSTLYVFDKYGIPTRTPPSLFVLESPDYQIKGVANRSDGTYRVSYIAAKSEVNFKYNLGGTTKVDKTLPAAVRPLWDPCEFSLSSPLSLLRAEGERIVARYTSKQAIVIQDFSVVLYRADESSKVLVKSARVTADPDRANTCCIWATLNETGTYYLHPAYRGLSLTSDPKSHHVRIMVEFDSYLFDPTDEQLLAPFERSWAKTSSNVRAYIDRFRVSAPKGGRRVASPFNFLPSVPPSPTEPYLDLWPIKLTFTIAPLDGMYSFDNSDDGSASLPPEQEADWRLTRLSVLYGTSAVSRLTYGRRPDTPSKDVTVTLLADERIVRFRVVTLPEEGCVSGVVLETSKGKKYDVPQGCGFGDAGAYESKKPDWCSGARGFWGGVGETGGVERLGVIWGK